MDNQRAMEILGEENAALLAEFLDKIEGKSFAAIPNILMEFKAKLPKDKIFTPEEKDFILEQAMANLPENEKNKYKTMLKMLKVV